ncbi:uncharacterized protein spag16 [Xenentodon cancila]
MEKKIISANDEDCKNMKETASTSPGRNQLPARQQISCNIPEPVEDFLRNFLRRAGLSRTLGTFETEWYRSARKPSTETRSTAATRATRIFFIHDALSHSQLLQSELDSVRRETDLLRQEAQAAAESLVRMQRERDFHRLQSQRVAEEKHALAKDLKQLKGHLELYEPVLSQLKVKYQAALRQKVLISLQKDQIQNTVDPRLTQERNRVKKESSVTSRSSADKASEKTQLPRDSEFPVCSIPPHSSLNVQPSKSSFRLLCSIRAHELPVSCVSLHPGKPILASTSDDHSWRLWDLQSAREKAGRVLRTGEGHSDWLSACSFHPDGSKLATTSGDTTVQLWDLSHGCSVLTLSGHSQPTWGCSFHSCGHFLASCSADRTAKVWDLNSHRCRLTLRRHTASVNSICFLPYSNLLLTCSSDKTLVLWDARLGICSTILHGHRFPCNHAAFNLVTHVVASCDSRGIINLWDVRKPASPMTAVDAGPMGANQVAFSESGELLAVATSDGLVRLVDVESCRVDKLVGHSDSVQSVTFDQKGETLMSAGSDGLINVWA